MKEKVKPLTDQIPSTIASQIPGSISTQVPGKLVEQLPGSVQSQIRDKPESVTKLEVNLNYHVFISGQTGSGKSVIGKFIFASLPKTKHAIFIDVKHDPSHENFISHFPVFTELNQIQNHFEEEKTFFGKKKDMRIIYRPKRIKSDSIKTHTLENPVWKMFNDLCEYCYAKGNILLFVDEAAVFSTPSTIVPAAYDILIMGRSRGVIMINVTQRPSNIHNNLISESYTRFLLRTELESDRIKLKGIVGQEVAEQLHGLENQVFIQSYVAGQWTKGHITIPPKFKWIIEK